MVRRSSKQEFVVIGLGRFGSNVALRLEEQGHTVLGIDRSEHLVQHMADHITQAVALDATNEDALRAVDMASFETAVVAIGSDFESNVLTTVALKAVGVRHVICKAPVVTFNALNCGANCCCAACSCSKRRLFITIPPLG